MTAQLFFNHSDGNLDLQVFSATGTLLASSTSTTADEERVDILAARGDDLGIRVFSPNGASNTYDLKVTNAVNRRVTAAGSQLFIAASGPK